MRYRWPDGKQSAVVLSFDFDAESGFLFREPEKAKRSLGDLEERRFGPRVGVDRILALLDKLKLRSSFFIPGWTVENHLAPSKRIRDAGHEIGAHGNVHEAVGFLDATQEERIMQEQLAILRDQLGVKPAGYRSPSWDVNVWTPGILKRHGFLYDTSLMGNDIPYEIDSENGPLVEVPVQWLMDDAPLFRHVYGSTNAIADPGRVLQMWSKEGSRSWRISWPSCAASAGCGSPPAKRWRAGTRAVRAPRWPGAGPRSARERSRSAGYTRDTRGIRPPHLLSPRLAARGEGLSSNGGPLPHWGRGFLPEISLSLLGRGQGEGRAPVQRRIDAYYRITVLHLHQSSRSGAVPAHRRQLDLAQCSPHARGGPTAPTGTASSTSGGWCSRARSSGS
ncbi:MAG: hypothetical protein DMD77_25115 [Candidatus Rokuibacteriota bacterium]|nr:MAG: hypothetical protein DMD77_25115 [Candidatus Rokubacteria bacterium]